MDQKKSSLTLTTLIVRLLLVIQLCVVVNSFKKYRGHHRKHNTVAKHAIIDHNNNKYDDGHKDGSANGVGDGPQEEIRLHNECYFRYANTDHHYAFVHWLHHKNVSHYTPISPSYDIILRKIQAEDIKDGLQISMGTAAAGEEQHQQKGCGDIKRRMKLAHPNMPIIDRALCQYEYILNYKPNRIPATLSEVKCICTQPFSIGSTRFECEPLYYHVRVLLFESDCLNYAEHVEKVAFACVPVFKASVDYDDSLIDVPAEEPN